MEATTAGTLSVTGVLAVTGSLDLDISTGTKGALDVGPGGTVEALAVQASLDATFDFAGGLVSIGGIGNSFFFLGATSDVASMHGGATMDAPVVFVAAGTLDVTGASVVNAGSLVLSTAGATLDIGGGVVSLSGIGAVDDGAIVQTTGTGAIDGSLSGSGALSIGAGDRLAVGDATGFTGTVSMAGGTLDLTKVAGGSSASLSYTGSSLVVGGTQTLDVGAGLSLSRFHVAADAGTGTLVMETPCYVAGTRIATEHGEVPVETLRPGDSVRTAEGRVAPVRWTGQMLVDLRQHPAPQSAAPVRIRAGAFAPGLPRRDLLVSGDHALFIDDALIPARKLINGATIRQDMTFATVTYVHVELDRHDLLLAEGLPAESFLDTGNRGQFPGNLGERALYPRFDADPQGRALHIFAEHGCAPLLLRGPLVSAAQARLRQRAEKLGWQLMLDPALTIESDEGPVTLAHDGPNLLQAMLPPGTRRVRLRSRSFMPLEMHPGSGDPRLLGVALSLMLDELPLPDVAFAEGWYPPDPDVDWRWTNGDALLKLPRRDRNSVLTLQILVCGANYWVEPSMAAAQQAA
jgi:hypothetical protein